MKKNFGKETKLSLGTVINNAMQTWTWGEGGCQLLSTAAIIFLPRLHLLNDSNYSKQNYNYRDVSKQQGFIHSIRREKRAYYFVLQLVQEWISGGGGCQLLSTAAIIFLSRLHLLKDPNYSIQKLLPLWCDETGKVEGFMRNKGRFQKRFSGFCPLRGGGTPQFR